MRTIVYVIFLACSVFLSGCVSARQTQEPPSPEKEPPAIIQIQNLTVTDANLILDYRVSNPFDDYIRVCRDTSAFGRTHVVTWVDDETVWIKLRFNLEMDHTLRNPEPIAKYVRLAPGECYSDRLILSLPIRNLSPVYDWDRQDRRKEREEIVLHRAVFEVGYFGTKFGKFFDVSRELNNRGEPVKGELIVVGEGHYITSNPLVVDEVQHGRSREIVYVRAGWPSIGEEESASVVLTDVNIPCSVPVDDK
jgi:hypothetical protein